MSGLKPDPRTTLRLKLRKRSKGTKQELARVRLHERKALRAAINVRAEA
jgi:hypothetical protein